MGKTFRKDAKNDRWRKAKQQKKSNKKTFHLSKDEIDRIDCEKKQGKYFEIGGLNDYAYGM